MSEPTITFVLGGKTITVVETPTSSSVVAPTKSTHSAKSTKATTSSSTAGTTASESTLPSSCISPTTTISDFAAAQFLGKACPTFIGSIVIPTEVSTPIDFSGMNELVGDLSCSGSQAEGFGTLSGGDLVTLTGNLNIENNRFLSNVSFPALKGLGGLDVVNNSVLYDFDSMTVLFNTTDGINMSGSFSRISFPELESVPGPFVVSSSNHLDCMLVAPNLHQKLSGQFSCASTNTSLGSGSIEYVPGGFTIKDKIIVSSIVGFLALLCAGIGIYCYIYRQTMRNTVNLAKETFTKKRAHKRATLQAGTQSGWRPMTTQPSPQPSRPASPRRVIPQSPNPEGRSFGVVRPHDQYASNHPELYDELQKLNDKANSHGLTPFERDRREYLSKLFVESGHAQVEPTIPKVG